MDTNYHINLVINTSSGHKRTNNDKQLAVEAESLYKEVVPAMIKAVQTGDWSKYCKSIENYDRFVWEQSHKGNEANMFANPKIKVGPSWLEQLWAPVFERIRIKIEMIWNEEFPDIKFELVLIQNQKKRVIESLPTVGSPDTKDVDGGIGVKFFIKEKEYILPIIVMEGKGGHFDKPLTRQVNNLFERFKETNQNILCIGIHDNNISVGKDCQVQSVASEYDAMIVQRGKNKSNEVYPLLNSSMFTLLEKTCIDYLKELSPMNFNQIQPCESDGILLRDYIDSQGCYMSPRLKEFI